MYKKLFAVISISLVFFFSACSPKALYQTTWESTPVVADGDPKEWRIPLRFYDSDTKLNYTLSNDDERIYLCVRIVDELSQAKVIRNGLNIWFDTLAKKNKQCGILFPVPDKGRDEYQTDGASGDGDGGHNRGGGKRGGGDVDAVKKKFLRQANQMQLINFKKGIPDYLAPENEYGINVSINWDVNNIMIYEASIPFKTFYKPALVAADSLRNIDFSMTIHGFPTPEKKDDGNSGGGGGSGMGGGMPGGGGMGGGMNGAGRGGMGGGGMGGGRGGGAGMRGAGSAEVNPMYETKSFWVKVRLSAK
ncbi:MAG: hypothetical protein ACHQII_02920 [Bacteroidia bacterium]